MGPHAIPWTVLATGVLIFSAGAFTSLWPLAVLGALAAAWGGVGLRKAARISDPGPLGALLEPGERILKVGPGRRVLGLRTPVGQLVLTDRRLWFAAEASTEPPHGVPLDDVRTVETFMGLGVLPNGVCLLVDGGEHRYLVPADRHRAWTSAIARARAKRPQRAAGSVQ